MAGTVKNTPTVTDARERAFQPISGHRALDLLATLRDRHRDASECLLEPADLDRWIAAAGLPVEPRATPRDLDEARSLRETVNRVVRATLAGESIAGDDLDELNLWTRRPALAPQAGPDLERTWAGPVQAALALIAREAVELLTSPDSGLIRECAAAPNCSRLYIDRSRAGGRRWCSMEWCGSRAKMSEYRRRRRASTA